MIRTLRRAHFVIWIVLAFVLVIGYAAGLRARKQPATMTLPPELGGAASPKTLANP